MSSKIRIDVEVPTGKEVVIKEYKPEYKVGKRVTPASSRVLASFKTGKGKIEWSIDGHSYLNVEEFDHQDL